MEAREKADLLFDRFFARIEKDAFGRPTSVALRIESPKVTGPFETEIRPFADDAELEGFVAAVDRSIKRGYQLCGWEGYDFEIMGETEAELDLLRDALAERSKPQVLVSFASVYDLSAYSSRVECIGEEKPFYSPYIAKKSDDDGWFPENILPVVSWIPAGEDEPVAVPVTPELRGHLEERIKEAVAHGLDSFTLKGFEQPFKVKEAEAILNTFEDVEAAVAKGGFDPGKSPEEEGEVESGHRRTPRHLVIHGNIQTVDYTEARRDVLTGGERELDLPAGLLRADVVLKDHQSVGVAWLQHLFSKAPSHCRGAVLGRRHGTR